MVCNSCENGFAGYQTVVVSIQKSGSKALLYIQNQGRNIVMIRRVLLCYTTATGGWGMLYLRPPPELITWTYPSGYLETGITALYYTLDISGVKIIQAQTEYIEIEGRSRSCTAEF